MVQIPSDQIKTREILNWKGLHLFHFRTSSCSQKLRIYLNLKKISWTPHSINLATGKNYSEFFLGINPKGLIPVLVDDGRVELRAMIFSCISKINFLKTHLFLTRIQQKLARY